MKKLILLLFFAVFFINFVNAETTYPYWIEHDEDNNLQDYVWVKVDSIPASGTKTIYAIKESGFSPNGDNVFELFDDFEGTSLNTSKWNTYGSPTLSFSSGILTISGDSGEGILDNIYSKTTFGYNVIFEGYVNVDYSSVNHFYFEFAEDYLGYKTDYSKQTALIGEASSSNANIFFATTDGSNRNGNSPGAWTGGWSHFIITRTSTDVKFTVGSYDWISNSNLPTGNLYALIGGNEIGASSYTFTGQLDWVRIRKYTATEPSVEVTDMGTYYKIDITNNEASTLTDYQVAIPINDLNITSTNENIKFTDTEPISQNFSVDIDYSPKDIESLSLDPENNITQINVSFMTYFLKQNVTLVYWNITQDGSLIFESVEDVSSYSFDLNYSEISNHTVCVNAIANGTTEPTQYNASKCISFHIDQYPQNLSLFWTPKLPIEEETITLEGNATDNGEITYNWIINDSRAVNYWIDPNLNYVWLNLPSIPANSTIVVEVNKLGNETPDGNKVFDIFSDMSNASLWALKRCSIDENSKTMTCTQLNNDYSILWYKELPSMYNISVVGEWLTTDNDGQNAGINLGTDAIISGENDISVYGNFYGIYPESSNQYTIFRHNETTSTQIYSIAFTLQANDNRTFDIRSFLNGSYPRFIYYDNGNLVSDWTDTTNPALPDDGGFIAIREWEGNLYWVGVRKFYGIDPSVQVSNESNYYSIQISNNHDMDLVDYVVPVPASQLGISSDNESLHVIRVKILRNNTGIRDFKLKFLRDDGTGYGVCLKAVDDYGLSKEFCDTIFVFEKAHILTNTSGTEYFSTIYSDPRLLVTHAIWDTNYGTFEKFENDLSVTLENQTMLSGIVNYTFKYGQDYRNYSSILPYITFNYTIHQGFFPVMANETLNASWNFSNAVDCFFDVYDQTYEWKGTNDSSITNVSWYWSEGRNVSLKVSCMDSDGNIGELTEEQAINSFRIEPIDEETGLYNITLWGDVQTGEAPLFRFIATREDFNTSFVWESINETVWLILDPIYNWFFRFEEHFTDQVIINSFDLGWSPSHLRLCVSPDLPNIYQTAYSSIPIEEKAFAITRAETGCLRSVNPTAYIENGYGFNFYTQAGQYAIWLLEKDKPFEDKTLLGSFFGEVKTVIDLEKLLILIQEAEKITFGAFDKITIEKVSGQNATIFKYHTNELISEFELNISKTPDGEPFFSQKVHDSSSISILLLWDSFDINRSTIIYVTYKATYQDGRYVTKTIRTTPTGREIKFLWWQTLLLLSFPAIIFFMRTFSLRNLAIFGIVYVIFALFILPFTEFNVITQAMGILSVIAFIIFVLIIRKVI